MSDSIPEPTHEEAALILQKARALVADMLEKTDEKVNAHIVAEMGCVHQDSG